MSVQAFYAECCLHTQCVVLSSLRFKMLNHVLIFICKQSLPRDDESNDFAISVYFNFKVELDSPTLT